MYCLSPQDMKDERAIIAAREICKAFLQADCVKISLTAFHSVLDAMVQAQIFHENEEFVKRIQSLRAFPHHDGAKRREALYSLMFIPFDAEGFPYEDLVNPFILNTFWGVLFNNTELQKSLSDLLVDVRRLGQISYSDSHSHEVINVKTLREQCFAADHARFLKVGDEPIYNTLDIFLLLNYLCPDNPKQQEAVLCQLHQNGKGVISAANRALGIFGSGTGFNSSKRNDILHFSLDDSGNITVSFRKVFRDIFFLGGASKKPNNFLMIEAKATINQEGDFKATLSTRITHNVKREDLPEAMVLYSPDVDGHKTSLRVESKRESLSM